MSNIVDIAVYDAKIKEMQEKQRREEVQQAAANIAKENTHSVVAVRFTTDGTPYMTVTGRVQLGQLSHAVALLQEHLFSLIRRSDDEG